MNALARYWKIVRINPAAGTSGYKQIPLTIAQEFVTSLASEVGDNNLQDTLLSFFKDDNPCVNAINRALAGLCLRCYISNSILKECKRIDYLFSGNKQFSYQDLLQFVLNDDGQELIILDKDKTTQLIVDKNNQTKRSTYNLFSVKVLQSFNTDLESRMSLDNWAYLQTKQNSELKNFLSELGLKHLSDWTLLNRATNKQLGRLSSQQRYIIEAYHAVYRRDRRQQHIQRAKKCPDPNNAQLQEMLVYLQQHQLSVNTPALLLKELNRIALQLRKYDIWNSRESLDIYDVQSNTYIHRQDLAANSFDEVDAEQQEFVQFLREHLDSTLSQTIKQEIETNIQQLQKSRTYAPFAQKYIQGLQLYYCQKMTLKEITPQLGMTSWNQARRILNPGELLSKIRAKTVEQMLESILNLAVKKGLTKIPTEANYIKYLAEQVESYIDKEIFQEAIEEIRAGKNRTMNSAYAEALRCYIQ